MSGDSGRRPTAGTRLQKYLAHAGVAARRRAEVEYIAAGRVTVNGRVVQDPAVRVRPGDDVRVDGRPVEPEATVTLLVYKPVGVISAASDGRGRPTVVDLVPSGLGRLYPVGRLDTDSEGLLLVTNDGALTQALLHPRRGLPRTYAALVAPAPSETQLRDLGVGAALSDGWARAQQVTRLPGPPAGVAHAPQASGAGWLSLVLHEGRNREARRLCAAVGLDVLRLVRTGFGPLVLSGLAPGAWRHLDAEEIVLLRRAAGRRPRVRGTMEPTPSAAERDGGGARRKVKGERGPVGLQSGRRA